MANRLKVAEGVGFEPTPPFRGGRISNPLRALPVFGGNPSNPRLTASETSEFTETKADFPGTRVGTVQHAGTP